MAPAERVDMLFDFSKHGGQKIILYTDTPAPFPDGDATTDYFPEWSVQENPVNGATLAGQGPNTRIITRFKVIAPTSADPVCVWPVRFVICPHLGAVLRRRLGRRVDI